MTQEPYLTPKRIASDPGMILLAVLLLMSAVIFIWWPTEVYVAEVSLVAWLMFATLPVSVFLTGYYVVWMERRESAALSHL
ncbi:hypothetical protein [Nesterenkonia natronophila]|uniref:Uncharacterized protein n=1 Tax=Nesterenkonia natronophila TaxID=2174932 RepID=A0A3A4FKN7_9MICC|nr:hypothetical protein [Nesterenkonia natronophila]RJN32985.1 hypothetical protein D3250_04030 [Nesterenkonia natronophila]